jgi:hypothetical protein
MMALTCMTTAQAHGSICWRNTDTIHVDAELNDTSSASISGGGDRHYSTLLCHALVPKYATLSERLDHSA